MPYSFTAFVVAQPTNKTANNTVMYLIMGQPDNRQLGVPVRLIHI